MKSIWFLVAVLLVAAAVLSGCMKATRNTDDIDGGVILDGSSDAPKTVASTQIASFSCEFSTLSLMEETVLENDVYELEAALEGDAVTGSVETRQSDKQTFTADAAFLEQLQQIVAQYDLAQFNGTVYKVCGLPDQYGAYLNVTYQSEEQIYASNNQDCFLPLGAMEELWELFLSQTNK